MTFKLKGLEGLKSQFKQIAADTQPKVLRSALRESFKPVLEAAQAKVPVDKGELRASLVIGTAKTENGGVAAGVMVNNNAAGLKQARVAAAAFGEGQLEAAPARRWHLTELGTAHSPAQPFLRPAMDENAQAVTERFTTALDKKIQQAVKRGGK